MPEDTDQIRVRLTFDGGEVIVRLEDNKYEEEKLCRLKEKSEWQQTLP